MRSVTLLPGGFLAEQPDMDPADADSELHRPRVLDRMVALMLNTSSFKAHFQAGEQNQICVSNSKDYEWDAHW